MVRTCTLSLEHVKRIAFWVSSLNNLAIGIIYLPCIQDWNLFRINNQIGIAILLHHMIIMITPHFEKNRQPHS